MKSGQKPTENAKQDSRGNHRSLVSKKIAATAGALVASVPVLPAAGDVIYNEGVPISLSAFDGQGSIANWDIDGANGADFQLWVRSSAFQSSNYFSSNSFFYSNVFYGIVNIASRSYLGNQLNGRGLVGPGGVRASALMNDFVVGPTLAGAYQWGIDDVFYRSAARADSAFYSNQSGTMFFNNSGPGADLVNFQNGSNLLGFRFDISGSLHYGWAEIAIAGGDVTITRWAYESEANLAIQVGDTGAIPEPSSLAILGMGAAGVLCLRRRKQKPAKT